MTDVDAYTRPLQLTKTMRRGLYSAIDTNKPELTAAGKVVIITGAGGGFGYDIAAAWATAGASGIVLAGRNIDTLKSAAENVKTIDEDIPHSYRKPTLHLKLMSRNCMRKLTRSLVGPMCS